MFPKVSAVFIYGISTNDVYFGEINTWTPSQGPLQHKWPEHFSFKPKYFTKCISYNPREERLHFFDFITQARLSVSPGMSCAPPASEIPGMVVKNSDFWPLSQIQNQNIWEKRLENTILNNSQVAHRIVMLLREVK